MNINSNGYVLGFAVGICVVMSAMLALTATALKSTQLAAEEFDRQKNVMMAAGLIDPEGHIGNATEVADRAEMEKLYKDRVEEKVLVLATGEFSDKTPQDYARMKPEEQTGYRVVAIAVDEQKQVEAYVLPISGRGLWSTIYGYLALEPDANKVKGVTFYKHGETPGLGGEIENPDWTSKWVGKLILENGKLESITVKKGTVDPAIPKEMRHMVDGLSGATITGRGVSKFLHQDLEAYQPYLRRIWGKGQ